MTCFPIQKNHYNLYQDTSTTMHTSICVQRTQNFKLEMVKVPNLLKGWADTGSLSPVSLRIPLPDGLSPLTATLLCREVTEEGSPLSEVISKGLDRPKFAADCLNVLMKELKLHCKEGTPNCKVMDQHVLFNTTVG